MNSRKNIAFFCFLISLLLIPFIPSSNARNSYVISEPEFIKQDNVLENSPPKLLPPPPTNGSYKAEYFDGLGVGYAMQIYNQLTDIFPLTNIPTTRIYDLTMVELALSCVDLYFVTGDVRYLDDGLIAVQSLNLDVNNTYIIGEEIASAYELKAAENLRLVIMYNRLAQGFQMDGNIGIATLLRSRANDLFSSLTNLFYHTPTGTINSTILLDKSTFEVMDSSQGSTARATGLYFMANFLSNQTAAYYGPAKIAVDNYRTNANVTFTLPSGEFGFIYRGSDEIGTVAYDEANLRGNIYMNTALMQISKYEKIQGSASASNNYYNWTDMGEQAIKEVFKSPDTNMFHTKYDFITPGLVDIALTYENCLYLSHSIEFKRYKLEQKGIAPSFIDITDLFNALYINVFNIPDFFQAGYTKSGFQLELVYDIIHSNPHIVNYQAITMLLKFYPLRTMFVFPSDLIPNVTAVCDWFIDIPETSSIFKASNITFAFNFEFDISSNTINNIFYPANRRLYTTSLDGVKLQSDQKISFNFTSFQGGDHFLTLQIKFANYVILNYDLFLGFKKLINISTDPSNLEVTQLVDSNLALTIRCDDETATAIADAEVFISIGPTEGPTEVISKLTDNNGYTTAYIPLSFFNYAKPDPAENPNISSFNTSITISVSKSGYIRRDIIKDVTIRLNELVLDLNPAPEGKEGQDLTIYMGVESRIEASLPTLEATIKIDNDTFTDTTGHSVFELPDTIIIGKEYLKADDTVLVQVTVDVPGLSIHVLDFKIYTVKMKTLERIYYWIEVAFQSDIVKVIGSLSIVWALLWKQFSLRISRRLRRCPYCGDTTKSKYPYCKNCGLKDMTREYKKEVTAKHKEARIIRNEQELANPPVEKTSYSKDTYHSQNQTFSRIDEQEDKKDYSRENDYQF